MLTAWRRPAGGELSPFTHQWLSTQGPLCSPSIHHGRSWSHTGESRLCSPDMMIVISVFLNNKEHEHDVSNTLLECISKCDLHEWMLWLEQWGKMFTCILLFFFLLPIKFSTLFFYLQEGRKSVFPWPRQLHSFTFHSHTFDWTDQTISSNVLKDIFFLLFLVVSHDIQRWYMYN